MLLLDGSSTGMATIGRSLQKSVQMTPLECFVVNYFCILSHVKCGKMPMSSYLSIPLKDRMSNDILYVLQRLK